MRVALLVVRNALGTALWLGLALLARSARVVGSLPDRVIQDTMELWTDLLAATTWRGRLLGLALLPVLATLPAWAGPATVSVMISALWFAHVGQAWNLMAGFAGRFSLGHCLFVGLGAYLGAGLLLHDGVGPWFGLLVSVPVAALAGAGVAALGCRRGLGAVHFALITLVCVELGRLAVGHLEWFGGLDGLVLPPPAKPGNALIALRGGPALYYYVILAMTGAALVACRLLTASSLGTRWRAVREDPAAAEAAGVNVYRARITAMAASAALTAPAGMFQAYYADALAPDQLFSLVRSVEILLGPVVGGVGTLFGPVLGALVVSPLGDALSELSSRSGHDLSALRPFCYGAALTVVALWAPRGLWPWLARRLRLTTPPPGEGGAP